MSYEFVDGVERELQKLAEFPAKVEANVIRGAVRAAAVVVRNAARPLIPLGKGTTHAGLHLVDTLRVSSRIAKGQATASVKVGNPKKGVFWAPYVLGGTKPHLIRGSAKGGLSFGGLIRSSVLHPGTRPQPFMDQANAAARDIALRAAFEYADDRLTQLIADQGNAYAGL